MHRYWMDEIKFAQNLPDRRWNTQGLISTDAFLATHVNARKF